MLFRPHSRVWAQTWRVRLILEREVLDRVDDRPEIADALLEFLARRCFGCGALVRDERVEELCPRCRQLRPWIAN